MKVYAQNNNLFIDTATDGATVAFRKERRGDLFSIWRSGAGGYIFQDVHFSNFTNEQGSMFANADLFDTYLQKLLTVTPLENRILDGGNF